MENVTLFEWFVGGIFVGINAYRRYNTPTSNRASTTFQNFCVYFLFYLLSVLSLYMIIGAMLNSSPETIGLLWGLFTGDMTAANTTLPSQLTNLSPPMVSALFLTTMLPSLPWLSRYDQALLHIFWDRGHIPQHVQKMAASMRRGAFNFSPRQIKILRDKCKSLNIPYESLSINSGSNLDFRWARINVLLDSIVEWQHDDVGRLRRFMQENQEELRKLFAIRDEINKEFYELKVEKNENRAMAKIESFLDKSLAELYRNTALFVAKATCVAELSESSRSSRISQLGFEGGMSGLDRISARQILNTMLAILLVFLLVSVIQQLFIPPQFRRFDNVLFITFLMMFTYGSALIIALGLRRNVGMGYNELTRQRSWFSYLLVGLITALSWFVITGSYRYIINMLSGIGSEANVNIVLTDLGWSFPYALQSLALAVSISWILDFHQSRGISEKLALKQRIFDVAVSVAVLGFMSITAFCWMEGRGWFEGFATKELQFQNKTSFVWFVAKGMAVAAVVGWLVPMWFHMNRTRASDQIAGRLIKMNKKGLSKEISHLEPNQLVKSVAAVSASVAAMGNNVSRNEADVYQIICGQLSGLPSSDVDIDSAKIEFEHHLKLAKNNELELEQKIKSLRHLPLLTSLLPYVATAIAFADGVYLDEERRLIEQIENIIHSGK
jgi:tellurite resistance protein